MKIIITGDILRPSPDGTPNQNNNIRWFYHLFNWQITRAADSPVQLLLWDEVNGGFDGKKFYALNGLEVSPESWVTLFDAKEVENPSEDYFLKFFSDSLVIGFELPEVFINIFQKHAITYIDFAIHPIRFLDDVFFGVRTNNKRIFGDLLKYRTSEDLYYIQANIHKATVSRMPELKLEPNSCLFVGQTELDRSLIENGRAFKAISFIDEINKIASGYSKLYYKPHPYAIDKVKVYEALSQSTQCEYIDENVYQILSSENIKEVITISSSVATEATYFGKRSTCLLRESIHTLKEEESDFSSIPYIPILDGFFSQRFWSDILCSEGIHGSLSIGFGNSRLRKSLQNFWGYNFLDYQILFNSLQIAKFSQPDSPSEAIQAARFKNRKFYNRREITKFDGETFIVKAYHAALGRDPDAQGFNFYLEKLENFEMSKLKILSILLHSEEGKKRGAIIKGMVINLLLQKIRNY